MSSKPSVHFAGIPPPEVTTDGSQSYRQLLPIDNVENAMRREYERQEEASQQSGMSSKRRSAHFEIPTLPEERPFEEAPTAADDNDIFRSFGRPDRTPFENSQKSVAAGAESGGSIVIGNIDLAAAAGIDVSSVVDGGEESQQQQLTAYQQEYVEQQYYDQRQYNNSYNAEYAETNVAPPPPSNAVSGGEIQYFYDPATGQPIPYTPVAAPSMDDQGSIGTTVTDDNQYDSVAGGSVVEKPQRPIIRSMSIDTSSASIYTQEYMDVLCNTAPGQLINFGELTNDNDEEYRSIMEEEGSITDASRPLLAAAAKARHYMATSEQYKNRKNIALPEVDMSNLGRFDRYYIVVSL